MAPLEKLGELIEELITAITTISSSNRDKFAACRESVTRSLRHHHHHTRTNQFDVESQLDGLEERFRVQGRDGLADALRERRIALEGCSTQWTPEILHLLLELSDQPTQKSRLSDLDSLKIADADPGPSLTWDEIAAEDGWDSDRALWQTVDYADSSDDDTDYLDSKSELSTDLETSSSEPSQSWRPVPVHHVEADSEELLRQIEKSQAWRYDEPPKDRDGKSHKLAVSDYQVLREVIFMLGGLPTSMFDSDCALVSRYQLVNVSWDAFRALATSFAEWGRSLRLLRQFSDHVQDVPLLQVFRASTQDLLRQLDQELSRIQARFLASASDVVVSLIKVQAELKPVLAPLCALSNVIRLLEEEQYAHPFRYLELLFDAAGAAQFEGNEPVYRCLGTVFLDCFQVYLRPIRQWMEEGALLPGDRTFFVSQSAAKVPLTCVWRDQFKLRQTRSGVLHAPRFLQPAVKRIFTTGKSVSVLRHLGLYQLARDQWTGQEPRLDFASICPDDVGLAPFSELFHQAFDHWVQSKHHATSATLRRVLFESCGLSAALDSLHRIYLGSDGSVSQAFAAALFTRLDGLNAGWKDRFTLTEMVREALSSCVDPYRLGANVDPRGLVHSAIASRGSVRVSLPAVRVTYRLNWPVQLVVSDSGMAGYQALFNLLLQLRRGAYVLRRHWFSRFGTRGAYDVTESHRLYWLVRTKLLWFCDTLHTYLTSIVLVPRIAALRDGLRDAVDVDDMIDAHASFIARTTAESCLGPKLAPLRECMLDVLDLALKLEDAQRAEAARETEEIQELSRLSVLSSPAKPPPHTPKKQRLSTGARRASGRESPVDTDEDSDSDAVDMLGGAPSETQRPFLDVLRDISSDYEKHLRFITSGLRGVARATQDPAANSWDTLAEMLEMGIHSS
ncbi:hypothetical protein VTK73DRAFT_10092 [Phialemonium thermophilum]|uniref:Spindle pole body component n=1 Tax=Phialemonium thermophilum TaxID=223376 RepID=A0ABR3VYN8_9PEZI